MSGDMPYITTRWVWLFRFTDELLWREHATDYTTEERARRSGWALTAQEQAHIEVRLVKRVTHQYEAGE